MPTTIEQTQDGIAAESVIVQQPQTELSIQSVVMQQTEDQGTIQSTVDTGGSTTLVSAGSGATTLGELTDIDVITEGRQDGSVLVYKTQTNKWTSTLLLNQQYMEGGEF